MDMKREEEFKSQFLKLEEIQEGNYGSIDMKSEIEVKEESFDVVEEEATNDGLSDNFRLDQNQ
ncbi:hypothetical protein Avbf_15228, partial [Armadillidium vulgare]